MPRTAPTARNDRASAATIASAHCRIGNAGAKTAPASAQRTPTKSAAIIESGAAGLSTSFCCTIKVP
ncbi:MAG: hypothetical protein KIT73_16500, partial [Burkholderiales bacterium]|nr:hypothetical protein [Burkholderiales bacterium]